MRRTTKSIAQEIRDEFPELRVTTQPWTSDTDGHVAGTRFRRQGKGRKGVRLEIWHRTPPMRHPSFYQPIYRHDSGETYRRCSDIDEWVAKYRECKKGKHRKFFWESPEPALCETCKVVEVP